jgi:hypothetical protein
MQHVPGQLPGENVAVDSWEVTEVETREKRSKRKAVDASESKTRKKRSRRTPVMTPERKKMPQRKKSNGNNKKYGRLRNDRVFMFEEK